MLKIFTKRQLLSFLLAVEEIIYDDTLDDTDKMLRIDEELGIMSEYECERFRQLFDHLNEMQRKYKD
ncbi:hypothetical protein V7128_00365 [Neobacillus vireti]|uniref:hypothetical protein n=1 Tax=Neobacillus vireti TaxID=220686 RepID=UPI002FFDE9F0